MLLPPPGPPGAVWTPTCVGGAGAGVGSLHGPQDAGNGPVQFRGAEVMQPGRGRAMPMLQLEVNVVDDSMPPLPRPSLGSAPATKAAILQS